MGVFGPMLGAKMDTVKKITEAKFVADVNSNQNDYDDDGKKLSLQRWMRLLTVFWGKP